MNELITGLTKKNLLQTLLKYCLPTTTDTTVPGELYTVTAYVVK